MNEPDSALLDLVTLLKYNPTLSDAYYHQRRIYHRKGNHQKASAWINKVQNLFMQGYFHQRPHVEQMYQWDAETD